MPLPSGQDCVSAELAAFIVQIRGGENPTTHLAKDCRELRLASRQGHDPTLRAALALEPLLQAGSLQAAFLLSATSLIGLKTLGMELAMPTVRQGLAAAAAKIVASSGRSVAVHASPRWCVSHGWKAVCQN